MQQDQALWTGVTNGDTLAFEKIYAAQYPRVRAFLRIYLGNCPVIDDVAQETMLQYWRRPDQFNPARSNLNAYLFGIARRKAADWWRHHKTVSNPALPIATSSSDSALLISDALEQLDSDLRNVLWLREVEGYSYGELAVILDVPLGTVRSRLFSARERLRRIWNDDQSGKEQV